MAAAIGLGCFANFDRLCPLNPHKIPLWCNFAAVFAGIGWQKPTSSADGTHEGQGVADIVGQRCQTELTSDILNATREEVPLAHPLLD